MTRLGGGVVMMSLAGCSSKEESTAESGGEVEAGGDSGTDAERDKNDDSSETTPGGDVMTPTEDESTPVPEQIPEIELTTKNLNHEDPHHRLEISWRARVHDRIGPVDADEPYLISDDDKKFVGVQCKITCKESVCLVRPLHFSIKGNWDWNDGRGQPVYMDGDGYALIKTELSPGETISRFVPIVVPRSAREGRLVAVQTPSSPYAAEWSHDPSLKFGFIGE